MGVFAPAFSFSFIFDAHIDIINMDRKETKFQITSIQKGMVV
jgi:hypothetical protein